MKKNKEDRVLIVEELLHTFSEALEYEEQTGSGMLKADMEACRRSVEEHLGTKLGCDIGRRIETEKLEDKDWLLEMWRILDEILHPLKIQTKYDIEFLELISVIWSKSEEELCGDIRKRLLRLKYESGYNYERYVDYFQRFPLWGDFDPENNNYQTIELRVSVLKERSYEFLWLYKRLEDEYSRHTLLAILKHWLFLFENEMCGWAKSKYRDYFEPDIFPNNKNDIFVDVGAYTGDTICDYIDVYGLGYKEIYAYEISPESIEQLKKNVEKFHDVHIRNVGVGAEKGTMNLCVNNESISANQLVSSEEKISEKDTLEKVEVVALDDDLDVIPTWIKMDIEGAEQSALLGCRKIIMEHHPKLAICTYHGYRDLWEIPALIDRFNPNYKFYLRHYGGNLVPTEFVLLCK